MSRGILAVLVGPFPKAALDAIERAGVTSDDRAGLTFVWYPDPTAQAWIRAQPDASVIAFTDRPGDVQAALHDGALDVVVGLPASLADRIAIVARVDGQWRRRHDAHIASELRIASELQSTRDLLSRLIDTTPCPVMAASPTGAVLVFNRTAEEVLGYDSDWVCSNLRVDEIYADRGDAERVLLAIRANPRRIARDLPVRLRTRSGVPIDVRLNASEVYAADGLPVATVGVFLDTRAESELRRRLESTTQQLIDVEQRSHAVNRALSRVHGLNQPLNTSMMTVEMLGMTGQLDERWSQRVERLYGQLERMARLIAELTQDHYRTPRGHQLLDALPRDEDSR